MPGRWPKIPIVNNQVSGNHDAGAGGISSDRGEQQHGMSPAGEGEGRFDLYLLDHTYPDASGVTICEWLRKLDTEMPILFCPGRAMPQERGAALRTGAQGPPD